MMCSPRSRSQTKIHFLLWVRHDGIRPLQGGRHKNKNLFSNGFGYHTQKKLSLLAVVGRRRVCVCRQKEKKEK